MELSMEPRHVRDLDILRLPSTAFGAPTESVPCRDSRATPSYSTDSDRRGNGLAQTVAFHCLPRVECCIVGSTYLFTPLLVPFTVNSLEYRNNQSLTQSTSNIDKPKRWKSIGVFDSGQGESKGSNTGREIATEQRRTR